MSDFLAYESDIRNDIESQIENKKTALAEGLIDSKKRESYKKAIEKCQENKDKYAGEIVKMLDDNGDYRSIDSNSRLYKAFFEENGAFYAFKEFVKKHNDEQSKIYHKLVIAFRGNEIVIYLNNHMLWELSASTGNNFKVRFNFNHSRYCGEWKKYFDDLCDEKKYGFVMEDSSDDCLPKPYDMIILKRSSKNYINDGSQYANVNGGTIGYIKSIKEKFDAEFVAGTFEIFEKLVDSFFKNSDDQFRNIVWEQLELSSEHRTSISELGKNPFVEKRWQQRLFHHFKFTDGDSDNQVFAYDLELSQAFPNANLTTIMGGNEPDILAVRFADGKAVKLVLIEVKSTYTACEGRSGIAQHVEGMSSYSKMQYFMKSRINDACKVFKNYRDSGLYPVLNDVDIDSVELLEPTDIEKVILLTPCRLHENDSNTDDTLSAIDYLQANWNVIDKINNIDPECKLWYTQSNYFDDDIDIKLNIQDLYDPNRAEAIRQIIAERKVKQSQNKSLSRTAVKNRTAQNTKDTKSKKNTKNTSLRGKIIKHAIFGEGVVMKHDVKPMGDMLTVKFGTEKKEINYQVCIDKGLIEVK